MPPKKQQSIDEHLEKKIEELTQEAKLARELDEALEKVRIRDINHKLPYVAFMAAIAYEHIDYVLEIIQEYEIGHYLIALETAKESHQETKGEHIHFVVQMTDQTYKNFSKRVFIDKFKLRGKALKDKPRQYGRVKNIENLDRMMAYTLKDGNIKTNFTEEELRKYKSITFQKQEAKTDNELVYNHVKASLDYKHYVGPKQIALQIIDFHKTNKTKQTLNRNYLNNMTFNYMMYYGREDENYVFSNLEIYNAIFGN